MITARNTANNDCKGWEFKALLRNTGGTTEVVGAAIVPVLTAETAGAAAWSVAITADNTTDSLAITCTGAAGATILWQAAIRVGEIA
jgi:hypothetical protein